MAEVQLQAVRRENNGKGHARRARMDGRVPAILYGRGMDPVSIEVDRRQLITALKTDAGMNMLLDIQVDGESTLALTKDLQTDPVAGTVLHADFVKVDRSVEIEVDVPIHLTGSAIGVREGGVLDQTLHEAQVRCLPTDVPESVDVDISELAIGDSLRVADLSSGRKFEILNDPDETVVTIATPITEEQLAELEADAGVVQEPTDVEQAAAAEAAPSGGEDVPETPNEAE